jgi:hypothetical protein
MVVVLAAYFISNVYQKWKETPVKLNPLFFSCFNFSPKH